MNLHPPVQHYILMQLTTLIMTFPSDLEWQNETLIDKEIHNSAKVAFPGFMSHPKSFWRTNIKVASTINNSMSITEKRTHIWNFTFIHTHTHTPVANPIDRNPRRCTKKRVPFLETLFFQAQISTHTHAYSVGVSFSKVKEKALFLQKSHRK